MKGGTRVNFWAAWTNLFKTGHTKQWNLRELRNPLVQLSNFTLRKRKPQCITGLFCTEHTCHSVVLCSQILKGASLEPSLCWGQALPFHFPNRKWVEFLRRSLKRQLRSLRGKMKEFLRRRGFNLCMCPRKAQCTILSFHSCSCSPSYPICTDGLQATALPEVTKAEQSRHCLGSDPSGEPQS